MADMADTVAMGGMVTMGGMVAMGGMVVTGVDTIMDGVVGVGEDWVGVAGGARASTSMSDGAIHITGMGTIHTTATATTVHITATTAPTTIAATTRTIAHMVTTATTVGIDITGSSSCALNRKPRLRKKRGFPRNEMRFDAAEMRGERAAPAPQFRFGVLVPFALTHLNPARKNPGRIWRG